MNIYKKLSTYWIAKSILILLVVLSSAPSFAQDSLAVYKLDSVHSARKSAIVAAIIPGGGHIYNQIYKTSDMKNKLWWKLPIVYGGLGAAVYFTVFNHQEYTFFHNERLNRLDPNFATNLAYSDGQLKTLQEQYRAWRDYSIIAGLGVYLLQLVDANVEGHLMHFDISNELSLDAHPSLMFSQDKNMIFGGGIVISFR